MIDKTIQLELCADHCFTVNVTLYDEEESPIQIVVPEEKKWYTVADAKALVKLINAAIKELK